MASGYMWSGPQEWCQALRTVPPPPSPQNAPRSNHPTPRDQKHCWLFCLRNDPQGFQVLTILLRNLQHYVYLKNVKELRYCHDFPSKTVSIPSSFFIFQSHQSKLSFFLPPRRRKSPQPGRKHPAEASSASIRRHGAGLFPQPRPLPPRQQDASSPPTTRTVSVCPDVLVSSSPLPLRAGESGRPGGIKQQQC